MKAIQLTATRTNHFPFMKGSSASTIKTALFLIFLITNGASNVFSQGCWTQVASMPQARYDAVSFTIGDTAYVLTGQASGGQWRDEFFKYDVNANTWTQLPDFPGTPRTGAVGFSINDKGYLGTGRDDNGNTDEFWEYDPITANWTQKTDYPPGNREGAIGFSIGNKGYIGLGLNGSAKTDLYEYDPITNAWTQKANFPFPAGRHNAVAFSIGTKAYVGTGYYSGFTRTNDFWEYNPATNSWLQLSNVPGPLRAEASGFSVGGVGYLGVGNQYSDFYRYDVSSDTWTQITDYGPGKRYKAAAFVVNDIAYLGSGYYLATKSDWWKFSPSSYEYLTPLVGCDSVLYASNYYSSSDTVLTIVPGVTANVCDSVYIQPIHILNSYAIALPNITACDSTFYGGTYYYQDTILYQNLTSTVTGCDSIITRGILITNSTYATDATSACESYTWIDGNTYTASNNSATFTLPNSLGCDSIITLDLTINASNSGTDIISTCESYTWIDGNTYTGNNNSATYTLATTQGCDSIVTLNLSFDTVSTSVTQIGNLLSADETGATYQWLNCPSFSPINGATNQSFTATSNGEYALVVSNSNCSDTSTCFAVLDNSVLENEFEKAPLVYPNPSNGLVTIDLGTIYPSTIVQLTDLRGNLVQSAVYTNQKLIELQTDVSSGVYLLILEAAGKRAVIMLMIE